MISQTYFSFPYFTKCKESDLWHNVYIYIQDIYNTLVQCFPRTFLHKDCRAFKHQGNYIDERESMLISYNRNVLKVLVVVFITVSQCTVVSQDWNWLHNGFHIISIYLWTSNWNSFSGAMTGKLWPCKHFFRANTFHNPHLTSHQVW